MEERSIYEEHISTGLLFSQNKEYISAIAHFNKALQIKEDKSVILERGRCYLEIGDLENATADVDVILAEDPQNFKAILLKADILFASKFFDSALSFYAKGYTIRKDIIDFSIGIRKSKMALNSQEDVIDRDIQDVAFLLENVANLIPVEVEKPPTVTPLASNVPHSLTIEIPSSPSHTLPKNSPRTSLVNKNSPRSSVSSESNILKISSNRAKRNYVLKDVDSSPMYLVNSSQSPRKNTASNDSPSRVYMASHRLSSRTQPYQDMLRNLQTDLHRKITTESPSSSPSFSPRSPSGVNKFSSPSHNKTVTITSAQQSITGLDSPKSKFSLPPIHSTHSPRQKSSANALASPMRASSINKESYVKSVQMEQEKSKSFSLKVDNINILANVAREIDRGHYNAALQMANEYFYHIIHQPNINHPEEVEVNNPFLFDAEETSSNCNSTATTLTSSMFTTPTPSSLSQSPPQQYICAKLYECIGVAYLKMHQIEKAIFYFHQQINIASDNNYQQVYADGLEYLINIYFEARNFLECIKFLEMKQLLLTHKPSELLELYEKLGFCYGKLQQLDQAVIAYFLAHDIAVARKNIKKQLELLNRIGELYCMIGNFGDAIKTCKIYIQSAQKVQDGKRMAEGFGTLANMYLKLLEAQNSEKREQIEASFLQPLSTGKTVPQLKQQKQEDEESINLSEIEKQGDLGISKESSLLSSLTSLQHPLKSGGKKSTLIGVYTTDEIIKKVAHYQQKALQLLNNQYGIWNQEELP